jgi:hypothetical protein
MKKPTQEQIEEFWGWCEVGKINYSGNGDPHLLSDFRQDFPPIDLNNIFKYAVPKVRGVELKVINLEKTGNLSGQYCSAQIQVNETGELKHSGIWDTPAHALFWAIWEVKKNEIRD